MFEYRLQVLSDRVIALEKSARRTKFWIRFFIVFFAVSFALSFTDAYKLYQADLLAHPVFTQEQVYQPVAEPVAAPVVVPETTEERIKRMYYEGVYGK